MDGAVVDDGHVCTEQTTKWSTVVASFGQSCLGEIILSMD